MSDDSSVWVFSGAGGRFASGVFTDMQTASEWISINSLTGVLTKYPLGQSVYDWALANNFFEIKKDHESGPEFIQKFTCAMQEHYHFEAGKRD